MRRTERDPTSTPMSLGECEWLDSKTGTVSICDPDGSAFPGLTYDCFLNMPLGTACTLVARDERTGHVFCTARAEVASGHWFMWLFFNDLLLSKLCLFVERTPGGHRVYEERRRRRFHDAFLQRCFGGTDLTYPWGSVRSLWDWRFSPGDAGWNRIDDIRTALIEVSEVLP